MGPRRAQYCALTYFSSSFADRFLGRKVGPLMESKVGPNLSSEVDADPTSEAFTVAS